MKFIREWNQFGYYYINEANKSLTTDEFIKRAKEVHGDKYDYSRVDYVSKFDKIKIICPKHGEFEQLPYNHLRGSGCPKCGTESTIRKNMEDIDSFIRRAKEIHGDKWDYSKANYKGTHSKVTIICPIHGDFDQEVGNHLKGAGCPKCARNARKLDNESFIKKATDVHGDKYDYSRVDYKSGGDKVDIFCKKHGLFSQTPESHLQGRGCSKCSGRFPLDTDYFIEKSREVHGDKYDYSRVNYKGNKNKVDIVCPIHGLFSQTPMSHLNGSACPKCAIKNTETFIRDAIKIHGDKYDYSKVDYKNGKSKVDIYCKKHGLFSQTPSSHLYGCGCPICKESKGESNVMRSLDELKIRYKRFMKFNDCRGLSGWKLSFDFYLPDYNMCIEYDGEQHFRSVNRFGGDDVFKKQQENDKIKNDYCKDKGITILRIGYKISGYKNILAYLKEYFDL